MQLDTNIVIHACKPDGAWLSAWTRHPQAACASVTRVEALGFTSISTEEDEAIRTFLSAILSYALEYGVPLVTRNVDDFKHIPGLQIINPFAGQT